MLHVTSVCFVDHKLPEGGDWAPFLSFLVMAPLLYFKWRRTPQCVKQNLVAAVRVLFKLGLGCCCSRTSVIGYNCLQFFTSLPPHRSIPAHGVPSIACPFIFLMLASKRRLAEWASLSMEWLVGSWLCFHITFFNCVKNTKTGWQEYGKEFVKGL